MEDYTVYMHVFPNGKKYIGITRGDIAERWKNGFGYKTQFVFTAIVKYGWDNIEHRILFTNLSKADACQKEKELIAKYKTTINENGYNVDLGGDSQGFHSEETKKKISDSHKGKTVSEETKQKLRIAMTEERKEKMKTRSIQVCAIPVVCVETEIVYQSARQAHQMTGVDLASICKCCRHIPRYKTAGGFHWEYANRPNIEKGETNGMV